MIKSRFAAVAAVLLVVGSSFAGTISSGTPTFTSKTAIVDAQHELLAVPMAQEADNVVVVGPSDVFVDSPGDPDNSTYSIDLATVVSAAGPIIVTDIGWDVTIAPIDTSWYSEATFSFMTDTDPAGGIVQPISLAPGSADTFAGNGVPITYSSGGLVNLIDAISENLVSLDGILSLELSESFDDFADATDADLLAGSSITIGYQDALTFETHTLEVQWVPEPASISLFGIASLGLLLFRRK